MDDTVNSAIEQAIPLFIVLNPGAGKGDSPETRATIEHALSEAGRVYELHVVEGGASVGGIAARVAQQAAEQGGAVVAAGGDGTVSAVARAAVAHGCAFGILPQGTFNYFGRAHGIPQEVSESVQLLLRARPRPIQVGMVNDTIFLVNASLGLHPQMLEDREAFTRQHGRSRWAALWAGLKTLLHYRRQLRLRIDLHGEERKVHTPTLFVSNNWFQLDQIGVPLSKELSQGRLVALMLRPVGFLGLLWLLLRGAYGQLGQAKNVISFSFDRMRVRRPGFHGHRHVKVALDGEIHEFEAPLEFRVSPQPLIMLLPAQT